MSDLDAFRTETRVWLEENCPASMRTPLEDPEEDFWGGPDHVFKNPDTRVWFELMRDKGWTAPTWPKEYGGAGLSEAENRVLEAELSRISARIALKSFGIWMLGPVLLEFGTKEQQARFLPAIARGETRWCQGYSEPAAGSDLASLATRAADQGDHYSIDGSKIWTSRADESDWMFCLVRTDPDAPKRSGISFVLIDMKTPGVSVRPIQLISGASLFCETFFEAVRVPKENQVGELNKGWTIAKRLLQHERAFISRLRDESPEDLEALPEVARRALGSKAGERLPDEALRTELAQVELDFLCNKLTLQRSNQAIAAGRGPGPETSMFKYYGTELNQRRKDLKISLLGYDAVGWEGPGYEEIDLTYTRQWLRTRANTIEGGTSEVQLNIIAKRVLGLPD